MGVLEKEYYTIEEALKKLQDRGIKEITKDTDLYYCAENDKLKFSVYVNSRPVFATQLLEDSLFFIGCCKLLGVFTLEKEYLYQFIGQDCCEIPAFRFDSHFKGKPKIIDWSMNLPDDIVRANFDDVVKNWKPKPFNENLQIFGFTLMVEPVLYIDPQYLQSQQRGRIPYKNIPSGIKINDLGKTAIEKQNWIFKKTDLRITRDDLEEFINLLNTEQGCTESCKKDGVEKVDRYREENKKSHGYYQNLQMLVDADVKSGIGCTAFIRKLSNYYKLKDKNKYTRDGFEDICSDVHLDGKTIHFKDGDLGLMKIRESSLPRYFTRANKKKRNGEL